MGRKKEQVIGLDFSAKKYCLRDEIIGNGFKLINYCRLNFGK